MDSTDVQLIALLRQSARASVATLARKLGVSRGTVNNRLKRLEDQGVIVGYTVRLRPDVQTDKTAPAVAEILKDLAQIKIVANVRPSLEEEQLAPAREAIHEFFLAHVMSHSPGYDKLLSWTPVPVLPTPSAVGEMINSFAKSRWF